MYIKYYTRSFMKKALARLDSFKPAIPLHNQGVQQSLPQPIRQILIFNDIGCDVMDMGYSSYYLSYIIGVIVYLNMKQHSNMNRDE